jgi:hypothetical protein
MMEWKWTKGAPYAKSQRPVKNATNNNNNNNISNIDTNNNNNNYAEIDSNYENQNTVSEKEVEHSAYSISLNHDENTWDILNQGLYNNDFRQSSKREDLDSKISGRELVQQCGYNPFMENSNYANDISVSNQFLQPQNTTFGREKTEQGN